MTWEDTKALPWGVPLLFGGGLSLASNIERHGLATYLGGLAGGLAGLPFLVILCAIAFGILMLTELTSNTATAATLLPVGGALALSLGQNPRLVMIPIALAANCSYMLPVGTPPNAVVNLPLAQLAENVPYALPIARSDAIAHASLPEIRARTSPGMAMAEMIPMIATTISSSMSVKPCALRRVTVTFFCLSRGLLMPIAS